MSCGKKIGQGKIGNLSQVGGLLFDINLSGKASLRRGHVSKALKNSRQALYLVLGILSTGGSGVRLKHQQVHPERVIFKLKPQGT